MNLSDLAVRTTARETFTGEEAVQMAALVFKRFGRDLEAATSAWRRLLGNGCTEADFQKLVEAHEDLTNPCANGVRAFHAACDAKADRWVPANGGTETPCTYKSGRRLLYVFNPAEGRHAFLDLDRDTILSHEEAIKAIGN